MICSWNNITVCANEDDMQANGTCNQVEPYTTCMLVNTALSGRLYSTYSRLNTLTVLWCGCHGWGWGAISNVIWGQYRAAVGGGWSEPSLCGGNSSPGQSSMTGAQQRVGLLHPPPTAALYWPQMTLEMAPQRQSWQPYQRTVSVYVALNRVGRTVRKKTLIL